MFLWKIVNQRHFKDGGYAYAGWKHGRTENESYRDRSETLFFQMDEATWCDNPQDAREKHVVQVPERQATNLKTKTTIPVDSERNDKYPGLLPVPFQASDESRVRNRVQGVFQRRDASRRVLSNLDTAIVDLR